MKFGECRELLLGKRFSLKMKGMVYPVMQTAGVKIGKDLKKRFSTSGGLFVDLEKAFDTVPRKVME